MPAVTRRRDRNLPQECWRIYYGDVHTPARSRSVSAIPVQLRSGNGAAASIRARGRECAPTAWPRRSKRRALPLKQRGACSWRGASGRTSEPGTISKRGPRRNIAASIAGSACRRNSGPEPRDMLFGSSRSVPLTIHSPCPPGSLPPSKSPPPEGGRPRV
jgi:hypothetical protein